MMLILDLILCAAFVAIVVRVVYRYRATTGTRWQRIKATTEQSLALAVGYLTTVGGFAIDMSGQIADAFDLPSAKEWIQGNLPPKYVGAMIGGIGLIYVAARLRSIVAFLRGLGS